MVRACLPRRYPAMSSRRPQLCERMLRTIMWPRGTDIATVEDKAVVNVFPIFFGNKSLEILRYLVDIAIIGKVESAREAQHVRVRRYSLPDTKKFAENDVRRFVTDAVQGLQLLCRARNASSEFFLDILRGRDDGFCFVSEKRYR